MATVNYFEAGEGIYGYAFIGGRYTLESASADEVVLTLNGGISTDEYPASIVLGLENIEFYIASSGPNAGNPVISGGEITSVTYRDETDATVVEITDIALDALLVNSWIENDSLFEFYQYAVQGGSTFNGSNGNDDIKTGVGDDTVFGNGGNDFMGDYGGSDNYVGGTGFDTITYEDWYFNPVGQTQGIEVTYTAARSGTIVGPDGETDTFSNIEQIRGTMLDDTVTGTAGDQEFYGLAGDDFIDGGADRDTMYYSNDARYGGLAGVEVDLSGAVGTATDGFGNTDTLISIERIFGTDQDDLIIDNANADNNFKGRGGDDIFVFSGGNNFAEGNEGADEYRFVDGATGFTDIDFDPAEDVFRFEGASGIGDLSGSQTADGFQIYLGDLTVQLNNVTFNELSLSNVEFGVA